MVQDDSKTRVKRRVLVGFLALFAVAAAVCALRAEKTIDALYAGARTGFTPYGSYRAIPRHTVGADYSGNLTIFDPSEAKDPDGEPLSRTPWTYVAVYEDRSQDKFLNGFLEETDDPNKYNLVDSAEGPVGTLRLSYKDDRGRAVGYLEIDGDRMGLMGS